MFINLTVFVASTIIFFVARLYPLWPHRGRGCDAHYFLMCAQVLRQSFRLPVKLPLKYLAEEQEQWYPPLFSMLLAVLPRAWLQKNHWIVNHLLDFLVALGLFGIASSLVGALGAMALVFIYAIQPALVQEFQTLTSRPLGMIIQLVTIFSGYVFVFEDSAIAGLIAAAAFATLVYSHKLSIQLLWFLLPFLSLATGAWEWIAILIFGYALAALAWPRMFIKIQRAHWDIVRFWAREWPLLGAHPVRDSPIYGGKGSSTAYYQNLSIRRPTAFLKTVLQLNIFSVFLVLPLFIPMPDQPIAAFFWWWSAGIYGVVAATHFLKPLRCFGLAQQYVKFSYIPVLSFTALYVNDGSKIALMLAMLCALVLLRSYLLTVRSLRRMPRELGFGRVDDLVDFLESQSAPRIMVFPYHLYDELAYRSKAQVLWGTHGYGFDNVRSFFPVLKCRIEKIAEAFALTHIIVDKRYVAIEELGMNAEDVDFEIGSFLVINAK